MLSDLRVVYHLAKAALDPDRPLIANLIVTRRCNLSCTYCHEWDKTSPPVPTAVLKERIDHLARLRAVFVTLTGGESLLHPDAAELVRYIRVRGMTPFLNTNGYLLTRDWIEALNDAGLYGMQLSIDNVTPNDVSKKSLKVLRGKLQLLADHAKFRVRINCVLGSSPPAEAVEVARTAIGLGFDISTSLVRNGDGSLVGLESETRSAYEEIRGLGRRAPKYLQDDFQLALADGGAADWKCRAGARTFYVCQDGLVHLCAPRLGANAIPLADYTVDDIRHAFNSPKPCASTCPIAYAHHASRLDGRRSQSLPPMEFSTEHLVQIKPFRRPAPAQPSR